MNPFRYTISRQTYTKIAGIPQPEVEQVEGLSSLDSAAHRIVDYALEDPGVVFQVHDTLSQDFFAIYAGPGETKEDLIGEVLEALRMFDRMPAPEEARG